MKFDITRFTNQLNNQRLLLYTLALVRKDSTKILVCKQVQFNVRIPLIYSTTWVKGENGQNLIFSEI